MCVGVVSENPFLPSSLWRLCPGWLCWQEAGVRDIAGASPDGAWRGLRVRVGLHTGACLSDVDPTTKRIDYFGNAVNLSARVESQAEVPH